MDAPCSLPLDLHIRIELCTDSLLLYRQDDRYVRAAVRKVDGPLRGILCSNGWMLVHRPTEAELYGMPLCGAVGSWERAYEDMFIELFTRTSDEKEWSMVERWNDLPFTRHP